MRVFVLSPGRSGSMTFAKACEHITNYSTGHETNIWRAIGRLTYPDNHIEVDNRLSWFLGPLADAYPGAFYVHLIRDPKAVAASYADRLHDDSGLMAAFSKGILFRPDHADRWQTAQLMANTVQANIAHFVRGKSYVNVHVDPVRIHHEFDYFWHAIGAKGDLEAAHDELDRNYNASGGEM